MIKQMIKIVFVGILVSGCAFPNIQDDTKRTMTEARTTGVVLGTGIGRAIAEQQKDNDPKKKTAAGALIGLIFGDLVGKYVVSQKKPFQARELSLDERIQAAQQLYHELVQYNDSLAETLRAVNEENRRQVVLFAHKQRKFEELTKEQQDLLQRLAAADQELQEALAELNALKQAYQKEQSSEAQEQLRQQIALLEESIGSLYQTIRTFLV